MPPIIFWLINLCTTKWIGYVSVKYNSIIWFTSSLSILGGWHLPYSVLFFFDLRATFKETFRPSVLAVNHHQQKLISRAHTNSLLEATCLLIVDITSLTTPALFPLTCSSLPIKLLLPRRAYSRLGNLILMGPLRSNWKSQGVVAARGSTR